MTDRSTLLQQWLSREGYAEFDLTPASEDASFRSYLRLTTAAGSFIVMDAPPEREPCDQYIMVANKLRAAGLNAPEIIKQNLEQGFLLLTDFGASDYLSQLDADSEAGLYDDALAALLLMQQRIPAGDLPPYDEALLRREMGLFKDWFLQELLGIELDREQQETWEAVNRLLVANALEQPRVFVHRDYHSRNLMRVARDNPGILDFQDAVEGPITYDLVSLLRDCYVAWPRPRVEQLALDYHARISGCGLLDADAKQFMHWFDLMGSQRHLKAIGIFSRLKIRDGKHGFIGDIPRTFDYLRQVCAAEPSLAGLNSLLEQLGLARRVAQLAPR